MKKTLVLGSLLLSGWFVSAAAGGHKASENLTMFQQSFLAFYSGEAQKLVDLANEIEDGDWRPAEGIRSVKEVLLHVAQANYGLGSRLGHALPEGVNPRQLKAADKDAAIKILEDSIDFAKHAVSGVKEAELAEQVQLFGNEMPKMGVVMLVGNHLYEHLGQLIAYARSSGVVPPWSE